MAVNKKLQKKLIKEVEKRFKVKVIFVDVGDNCCAQADTGGGVVELDRKIAASKTVGYFLSALLHEAVHIMAYREGKWKVFHDPKHHDYMSISELRTFIATAWRAERWVEKEAQRLLALHYPGAKYWISYGRLKGRERSKDWFDSVFLKPFRETLRRKTLRKIDRGCGV